MSSQDDQFQKELREWLKSDNDGLTEFVVRYNQKSKRYKALEIWEMKEASLGRRISRGQAIKLFMDWKRKVFSDDPDIRDVELMELRVIAK